MKGHRFLPHTADVLVEASGSSFPEALEAAADGLFETMADTRKVEGEKRVEVAEKARDLGSLAVFTLSRLLSEMDAEGLFFREFKVKEFREEGGEFFVRGEAVGGEAKPGLGGTVVKAVTHHLLEAKEEKGKWVLRILLDI